MHHQSELVSFPPLYIYLFPSTQQPTNIRQTLITNKWHHYVSAYTCSHSAVPLALPIWISNVPQTNKYLNEILCFCFSSRCCMRIPIFNVLPISKVRDIEEANNKNIILTIMYRETVSLEENSLMFCVVFLIQNVIMKIKSWKSNMVKLASFNDRLLRISWLLNMVPSLKNGVFIQTWASWSPNKGLFLIVYIMGPYRTCTIFLQKELQCSKSHQTVCAVCLSVCNGVMSQNACCLNIASLQRYNTSLYNASKRCEKPNVDTAPSLPWSRKPTVETQTKPEKPLQNNHKFKLQTRQYW